jgi:hypothetical protein
MAKRIVGLLVVAIWTFVLAGCGAQQLVKPKGITFEPTIVGCSGPPTRCMSVNAAMLRESREAHNRRCPEDKPNVLIKIKGALGCVATLPPQGPTGVRPSDPEHGICTRPTLGHDVQSWRDRGCEQ